MRTDPRTGIPLARMPRGKIPHFELNVLTPSGMKIGINAPYTESGLAALRKYLKGIAAKNPRETT